jgi:hypothetical protein
MNKFLEILIIIGIFFVGLIFIGLAITIYQDVTTEEKPVNEAPVINLNQTNINATIGEPLILNATIVDDGTITSVIWDLESGPQTNFTQIGDDLYFTPQSNGTYIFKLEAQDDKNLITTIGVQIIVKSQGDCEPDERLVDGKCVEIPRPTCGPNQVYNRTDNVCYNKPLPPKPVCTTSQVYNATTNKCDPKPAPVPVPTPTPVPSPTDIKVAVVGDIEDSSGGNAIFSQIQKQNPKYVFVLGDLGYESDLSWFKQTYGTMGDKVFCMVGNHEADNEDGSSAIEKETLNYCGNSYWIKYGATLFLVVNSNDKQDTLTTAFGKVLSNTTVMNGVKSLHVLSHKGCVTPPNSHHPAGEIKVFCDWIKSKIPSGIKVYYDSAHNHVMSQSADKAYSQSGAGGKSHYTCGTNAQFPFCNNTKWGFLLYTIKLDGTTTSSFLDQNGAKIYP